MKFRVLNIISSDATNGFLLSSRLGSRRFWRQWLIAIFGFSFIHSITLGIAPFLHKDEFMIVDLGRVILHPTTNWSITWMIEQNQPVFLWTYLGPVFQEFSYQVLGQYGPRILALTGALFAATVMVGWLLAKGTAKYAAFILGIVFLLDPLFVGAYSMGRVDGWAMAFSLVSCFILRNTSNNFPSSSSFKGVLLAGASAGLACFIWPSVVFLIPLMLLELVCLVTKRVTANQNWREALFLLVWFGVGAIITCILVLLPILPQLSRQFNNVLEGVNINTRYGQGGVNGLSIILHGTSSFIELLRVLKFSFILSFIALVASIGLRKKGLILAGLVAMMLMVFTIVYIHRVQYLLPYLIASVACIYPYKWWEQAFTSKNITRLKTVALATLLAWSLGLSLFARSILAFSDWKERKRELVYQAAMERIGPGKYSVLLPVPEFYYAGRSLGWKMYAPYLAVGDPISPENIHQVLPNIDYAIFQQSQVTDLMIQQLGKEGMKDLGWLWIYNDTISKSDNRTTNIKRLRNLYSIYRRPYGPYRLFGREPGRLISIQGH